MYKKYVINPELGGEVDLHGRGGRIVPSMDIFSAGPPPQPLQQL